MAIYARHCIKHHFVLKILHLPCSSGKTNVGGSSLGGVKVSLASGAQAQFIEGRLGVFVKKLSSLIK